MQPKVRMLLAAVLLFSSLSAGCAGEPKHPTWGNSTGAEQHERLIWQSMKSQRWLEVESHLAPTFVGIGPDGKKYDRAGWLAYWKSSHLGEYSLGEATVDPSGADMVVSYILVFDSKPVSDSKPAGDPKTAGDSGATKNRVRTNQSLRVVSVWQSVKKGWILTATSLTPIKE